MASGLMENGFAIVVFEITNRVENKDEHVEKWNSGWGSSSLIKFDIACKIYVEVASHLPNTTPQATCHLPNSFFFLC